MQDVHSHYVATASLYALSSHLHAKFQVLFAIHDAQDAAHDPRSEYKIPVAFLAAIASLDKAQVRVENRLSLFFAEIFGTL